MSDDKFDVAVLGAGPGGYAAAFLAADMGMNVALIDQEPEPGGVCLNRGCIPSKALLHAAEVIYASREASQFGLAFDDPDIDLDKLRNWKQNDVVGAMNAGLRQLIKQRNVDYIQGRGTLTGSNTIQVKREGDTRTVQAERIILATGSRPAFPPTLPHTSPHVWTSRDALALGKIPERLLVVGGGYIGLEMATVYAALGSDVTVVEMTDSLLPGADRDLVRVLARSLDDKLSEIRLKTRVEELVSQDQGVIATLADEDNHYTKEQFDNVLIATGRRPNTEDLGLEHTGVVVDRGFVQVGPDRRTNDPSIYAIGDITGQPMLAHKASHEGRIAVEAIAGNDVRFDPRAIPAVVFTQPELAWTGITEAEAKAEGLDFTVGRFPWAASGRAKTLGGEGLTKLIIDNTTELILGAGIVGPGAGELIAEATLAIEMGAVANDLALTIHAHPTLAETLMEAAESFHGTATHIYRPKRR